VASRAEAVASACPVAWADFFLAPNYELNERACPGGTDELGFQLGSEFVEVGREGSAVLSSRSLHGGLSCRCCHDLLQGQWTRAGRR
jgi:hypothetical protein